MVVNGPKAGDMHIEVTADGSDMNRQITKDLPKLADYMDEAGEEGGERYGDGFSEGFWARMKKKITGDHISSRLGKDANEGGKKLGSQMGDSLVKGLLAELAVNKARLNKAQEQLLSVSPSRYPDTFNGLIAKARIYERSLKRVQRELKETMAAQGALGAIGAVSGNGKRDSIGDIFGRGLGAGSRNNGLNLLGKSIGGIINLTDKLRTGVSSLAKTFMTGFTSAAEGASFLQKTMSGLSAVGSQIGARLAAGISSLAAAGPAAAVAVVVLITVLSALVSVMSALLAIVTALAATIVSALVGAFVVLGGVILSVVAAGGLLTAMFMSMNKAQKEILKTSFAPVVSEMRGLAGLMLKEVVPAFSIWGENIRKAISLLAPLGTIMGQAFAQAGNTFTALLSGPGFQQFAAALGVFLPGIVRNLASAFGQFMNGVLSLFTIVMPYVAQFAGHLNKVATEFAAFASGSDGGNGRNRISDFVARAVGSLKSLWGAVKQVFGFIADVLFNPAAQQFGNDMFDGIKKSFMGFRRAIADGRLEKWFKDARQFGSALMAMFSGLSKVIGALYNSGILTGVGLAFRYIGLMMKVWAPIIRVVLTPLSLLFRAIDWVRRALITLSNAKFDLKIGGPAGQAIKWLNNIAGAAQKAWRWLKAVGAEKKAVAAGNLFGGFQNIISGAVDSLNFAASSNIDLSAFDTGGGGGGGGGGGVSSGAKKTAAGTKKLLKSLYSDAASIVKQAAKSISGAEVKEKLKGVIDQLQAAEKQMTKAGKKRSDKAQKILQAQRLSSTPRIDNLEDGLAQSNATLADYAAARGRIAVKIEAANQQLADAIAMRNDYSKAVNDSARSFGALTTAQAQTLDGVEQALTLGDITDNLQTRLDKIRSFQNNLNLLLAQGLSQSAYKQIVDAGVEGGSAYAQALVNGGPGAVGSVNNLVSQVDAAAAALGASTSSALYQAGVDAAQGLLDGLTTLDAQLEAAATALGNKIAKAVKKALGIKSPSTVMRDMMDSVGDGTEIGLDNQHVKVGNAAARLAGQIAVSPEVAAYAARQGQPATVSGNNGPAIAELHVHTPTEDPKAVAHEVLNEVTGRL